MDRKDWAHATSIRWEAQIQKNKRFSSVNFGSFFWAQPLVSLTVIFGHFLVACGKIQPQKCTKKLPPDKYPLEGETPHVAKRPTALRPCGIVADRENKIVARVAKRGIDANQEKQPRRWAVCLEARKNIKQRV